MRTIRTILSAFVLLSSLHFLGNELTTERLDLLETDSTLVEHIDLINYAHPDCDQGCTLTVKGYDQTMLIRINDQQQVEAPVILEGEVNVEGSQNIQLPPHVELFRISVGEHTVLGMQFPDGERLFGVPGTDDLSGDQQTRMIGGGWESGDRPHSHILFENDCARHSDGAVTMLMIKKVIDSYGNFIRYETTVINIPAKLTREYTINRCD